MTDAHGAHPGCPGHAVLAFRSAGVRAPLELSPPGRLQEANQLQTATDHLGGGEVIANQMDPSFWLKCTLFFFTPNKRPLPFLLSLSLCNWSFPPYFQLHLSSNCDGGYFLFDAAVQQECSKADNMIHRFFTCV